MRLHTFLGVATCFASVLLLSQSCTAVHDGLGASSSQAGASSSQAGASSSNADYDNPLLYPSQSLRPYSQEYSHVVFAPQDTPPHSAILPPLPPPRVGEDGRLAHSPPINRYIEWLDANRIKTLKRSNPLHRDTTIPFYEATPLYAVNEPREVIEQALRDHESVGIVNVHTREVQLIQLREGLSQLVPNELDEVLFLYELHPNVHKLKRALFGQLQDVPQPQPVDHFPHTKGIPILPEGSVTLEHMLTASRQDERAFWIPMGRTRHVLIRPLARHMLGTPNRHDVEDLPRVLREYEADKLKYGDAYASLKWGRPLHRVLEQDGAQVKRPKIPEYERFGSRDATRDQMIDALRKHGRFRLYLQGPGQAGGAYKVELVHSVEASRDPRMSVSIEPLGVYKSRMEKVLSKLRSFDIPK